MKDSEFYNTVRALLEPYFRVAPRTICFQSGQNSRRNLYILKVLNHLLYQRGVPAVVLCDTNVYKTRHFLNKLPEKLRSRVLANSVYRQYLKVTEVARTLLEELYLSQENLDVIELFLAGLRRLTARLIQSLGKQNPDMLFILDRTPFTGALYSKAIRKQVSVSDLSGFYDYSPRAHFFIQSTRQNKTPAEFQLYDSFEGLNERISLLVQKIRREYDMYVVHQKDADECVRQILTEVSKRLEH